MRSGEKFSWGDIFFTNWVIIEGEHFFIVVVVVILSYNY